MPAVADGPSASQARTAGPDSLRGSLIPLVMVLNDGSQTLPGRRRSPRRRGPAGGGKRRRGLRSAPITKTRTDDLDKYGASFIFAIASVSAKLAVAGLHTSSYALGCVTMTQIDDSDEAYFQYLIDCSSSSAARAQVLDIYLMITNDQRPS